MNSDFKKWIKYTLVAFAITGLVLTLAHNKAKANDECDNECMKALVEILIDLEKESGGD